MELQQNREYKYVISDLGECVIGTGYHQTLAASFEGKVTSAGLCEKLQDGWTVYGKSHGYGVRAKKSDEYIVALHAENILTNN